MLTAKKARKQLEDLKISCHRDTEVQNYFSILCVALLSKIVAQKGTDYISFFSLCFCVTVAKIAAKKSYCTNLPSLYFVLLNIASADEVCDARNDAMKYDSRFHTNKKATQSVA